MRRHIMKSQSQGRTEIGKNTYDDVVIGSSPMMLLQAGMLAREGRRVCLIEREVRLGGSWQTAILENGEEVEIACHLIEVFPGIYEFLECASGAPFEALDAQPIRIHRSGIIFPYFNRLLMLLSGARLIIGLAIERINVALGRTKNRNQLINFQKKLSSFINHQGPAFFQRQDMQGPKHGFVDFMNRLIARTKLDGVEILRFDVKSMTRSVDGLWHLKNEKSKLVSAEHAHCTTSTNLCPVATGHFEAKPQEFAHRLGIITEVSNDAVQVSQTYVAFWADPTIARISRIDMPEKRSYQHFLIEFHKHDFVTQKNWHLEVRCHMERARIIEKGGPYKVIGQVDCLFTTNVDQLPSGEIDTNLWTYYSMGNLAAGIAAWRKTERIPQLSKCNISKMVT